MMMKNTIKPVMRSTILLVVVLVLSSISVSGQQKQKLNNQMLTDNYQDIKSFYDISVSIQEKNISLDEIFEGLEEQMELRFLYNQEVISESEYRLDLNFSEASVADVLKEVALQTGLTFRQINGTISVGVDKLRDPVVHAKVQSTITIEGTVTDMQTGEALPGANVAIQGTTQGSSTNVDGQYSISGVEPGTYNLTASFIGYQTSVEEITVRDDEEILNVDFALQQSDMALDELVVVGYGTQRRQDLTGSVATVQGESLENLAVGRVDEAIQGRVSGVNVMQNSGVPGGDISIRVRGTNSINAGSDPLFVVDGVPGAGNLNTIAPENIESIEVLKDASATAIYGARGSGGVIMITTKKGSRDGVRVNFDASYGMQQVSKKLDLLNATEYAELKNEAYVNDGLEPVYENPSSFGEGTDWQDQMFRTAPQQKYNISVAGGSEDITYRVAGNYLNQEGILIGSYFNRGGLRVNLDGDLGDKVSFGTILNISAQNTNTVGGQRVRNALQYNPILPVRDENGNYSRFNVPQLDIDNPVAEAHEIEVSNQQFQTFGNVFATYSLLEELELRLSLGGEVASSENQQYLPTNIVAGQQVGGQANVNIGNVNEWVSENTLTYNNVFKDRHNLTVLAGYTVQKNRTETVYTGAEDFVTDALGYKDLSAGSRYLAPDTGVQEWALQSYLFRTNYILSDKYLFTVTGRYDGSSRFGEGNRYGFFPSGSFAWRISNEEFFDVGSINDLKIRTSYGLTGNQNIGNYSALATMSTQNYVLGEGADINIGIGPNSLANPDLKWESTSQFDIGVDVSLFNSRVSVTADYYHKVTDDLLFEVTIPTQTGFSSFLDNIGSVKNTGFEFSLNSININRDDLVWNSSFNITANQNEVVELGQDESFFPDVTLGQASQININSLIVQEGKELGTFYGYIYDGVFSNQEEINAGAQPDAQLGSPRYVDVNGDGTFTSADKTIIGSGQADFYGGFTNTVFYKGFQFKLHLQGSYGSDVLNSNRIALESLSGGTNNLSAVKDRWTPSNRDSNIPRATAGGYPLRVSTRYIEDGSYLRIKNLTFSYDLSERILENSPIRSARIYLTGTNLYTITGYSGYDPGLNFQGGSNVAYSVDYNPYPTARTYTLGVSLEF